MKQFPNITGDMGQNINQFSEQRVSFDGLENKETHQQEVHKMPNAGDDEAFNRVTNTYDEMLRRVSNPELMALRNQNPFVSITPMALKSMFVVAQSNNDVRDVTLPDNTQMIRFTNNNLGDFFVGVNGQVTMPPVEDLTGNGPIMNPINEWFYVRGMRNISIGIPTLGNGVSIQCYVQL